MTRITLPILAVVLAMPAVPLPALAQDGLAQAPRQIGPWQHIRYVGPNGRAVRCDGERAFPSGGFLRFSAIPARAGGYTYRVTFSGAQGQLERLGASFPVTYWVDDEAGATQATATAGPTGFASFTEGNDEPGSSDAWRNGRNFSIRAGGQVLTYSLQGSNPLFRALHDCADKP